MITSSDKTTDKIAILLMAYGSPNSLDEIEPYYTEIRGGSKPAPAALQTLVARYQKIGGRSPLLDITRAQAHALQARLGEEYRVYVGMKHSSPRIAGAVNEIARAGLRRAVAIALAPHCSRFSKEGYFERVRAAIEMSNAPLDVKFVESWNDHPLFLRALAEKIQDARQAFGVKDWDEVHVIFTAHSLPEHILQSNDPYPRELRETCEGVADRVGLREWRLAYQSAGRTNVKWLGPEILDTLDEIAAAGCRRVLLAPIGFVADHLEILYDIDVECAERAHALGIEMRRAELPNATLTFIAALEAVVRQTISDWRTK